MRRRMTWLALLLLVLGPAMVAAQDTTVTGTIVARGTNSGKFDLNFTCKGEPLCTGTYQAAVQDSFCTTVFNLSGTIKISGLDLSRTGLITPVFTLGNFDFNDTVNADGTCSIKPGTFRDFVLAFAGSWDGVTGRLHTDLSGTDTLPFPPFSPITWTAAIDVTFTATRPAPPTPVFPITVQGSIDPGVSTMRVELLYRPQDAGTNPEVYVFALAPASKVRGAVLAKDDPVQCVLAQLTSGGQLQTVSASSLQAALNAAKTSLGAAVSVLNNVATPNVAGATFFVGYGSSPTAMLAGGINRPAATIPGSPVCSPQPPATGWWWNAAEPGRGFSVEVNGNNLFFAGFLYDATGRSTWHVATGPVSMGGSYFTGPLYAARGGQTLGGAYPGSPTLSEAGTITLAFNDDRNGAMVWPGGAVPLTRFDIVSGGAADTPTEDHPESGWWWNPQESGRGFFMEWQRGTLDMAGYLYDDQGNSVWYLAWNTMAPNATTFTGNWWSFANGQTLTGAWKPNQRINDNVAPVTVTFTSRTTAIMTLPNGRTTNLQRHRF